MVETRTKQRDDLKRMVNEAVLTAAMPADTDSLVSKGKQGESEKKAWHPKDGKRPQAVSPLSGAPTPPGRPLGVKNKLTNLRDAVLEAFDLVGGTQYLARLAEGTQSDRAAFVGLVAKVLPTQINANVEGGIQVQLSWLGQRSIGTTAAQTVEQVTQVVDLERDSGGKYRIVDQVPRSPGGEQAAPGGATAEAAGGDGSA